MNFFAHQDQAKNLTKKLIIYFLLAVVMIAISLSLLITTILDWTVYEQHYTNTQVTSYYQYLIDQHGNTIFWICTTTILVITTISLFRILSLRQGGQVIARWLGAREIGYDTQNPSEKRLLNIVDEITIASGIPRPGVYVMDNESGINAFAAGYTTKNSIVAVTRGSLEQLTRDQLQGVIAHEFSHILNGDMRLNIRLLGTLAGILFIGNIGLFILRSLAFSNRQSRNNQNLALITIGIGLAAIGYIGVFAGRLIRAAVSRQREYLADASAVQYTRNPDGIAEALNKIRLSGAGSRISNIRAEEMSHMYFSEAFQLRFLSTMLASHPPLNERIKRIKPDFNLNAIPDFESTNDNPAPVTTDNHFSEAINNLNPGNASAATLLATTGTITDEHIAYGQVVHAAIAPAILEQMASESGLRALLYALVFSDTLSYRTQQINYLQNLGESVVAEKAKSLYETVSTLDSKSRMPLFEMILPELRRQIVKQISHNAGNKKNTYKTALFDTAARNVVETIISLITYNQQTSLREFIYLMAVDATLNPENYRIIKPRYKSLAQIKQHVLILLALMAIAGHQQPKTRKQAYHAGLRAAQLGITNSPDSLTFSYNQCRNAMHKANQLSIAAKKMLLLALAETAIYDQSVTIEELDLLRVLAMSFDCPIPPVIKTITN